MNQRALTFASMAVLVLDGAALGFFGPIIRDLSNFPAATQLGLAFLVADLACAFVIMRRGVAGRAGFVAALCGVNAALVAASGIYVGQVDDAPGAGGIGLILLLANLATAVMATRKPKAI